MEWILLVQLRTSWAVLNKVNSTWSENCMEQSPCCMTAESSYTRRTAWSRVPVAWLQRAVTRVELEDQGGSRCLPPCAEAQGSLPCQKSQPLRASKHYSTLTMLKVIFLKLPSQRSSQFSQISATFSNDSSLTFALRCCLPIRRHSNSLSSIYKHQFLSSDLKSNEGIFEGWK